MKTIWKFPFEIQDKIVLNMPKGVSIIHVDVQKGQPCLWAIVDPEQIPELCTFYLRGTGQPFTGEEGHYIASFQMNDETLIFHLFTARILI